MEKKQNLRSFPPSERWMILNAYFTIIWIGILLKFISYNRVRLSIDAQAVRNKVNRNDHLAAKRIAEAVQVASQYVPGNPTCLVKALSGYYLLTKNHIPSEMYIGVKLGLPGQLNAHAWIMNQDEVILGNIEDLPTYTKLTTHSIHAV